MRIAYRWLRSWLWNWRKGPVCLLNTTSSTAAATTATASATTTTTVATALVAVVWWINQHQINSICLWIQVRW